MNQEVWRKVEELFHAALECAPEARPRFLDRACGGDTDLRRQVELVLAKEVQAGSFLEVLAIENMTLSLMAAELRYFGGLSVEETAEVLKISPETAKRDWKMAKAWLFGELTAERDRSGRR